MEAIMSEATRRRLSIVHRCGVTITFLFVCFQAGFASSAQFPPSRRISGVIVDHKEQALAGITVIAREAGGEQRTSTDDLGQIAIDIPDEESTLRVAGQYIKPQEHTVH